MIVEAFKDELVFNFRGIRIIPEVVKFVRIFLQVKEFTEVIAMIDDQFVFPGAIHCGEGGVAIAEFFGESVEVFGADAIAKVISRSVAAEDGAKAEALEVVREFDAGEIENGRAHVEEFDESLALNVCFD